jgi:hypothetical protein
MFLDLSQVPGVARVYSGFSTRHVQKEEETKPVKIQASAFTLEDHKKQLTAWIEAEHIPGKFQAWYTAPADPMHSDWRIKSVYKGPQELLEVEVPVRKMDVPEIVP